MSFRFIMFFIKKDAQYQQFMYTEAQNSSNALRLLEEVYKKYVVTLLCYAKHKKISEKKTDAGKHVSCGKLNK